MGKMNDLWLEETYGGYEAGNVGLVSNGPSQPMQGSDQ